MNSLPFPGVVSLSTLTTFGSLDASSFSTPVPLSSLSIGSPSSTVSDWPLFVDLLLFNGVLALLFGVLAVDAFREAC